MLQAELATAGDFGSIRRLLEAAGLPTVDLDATQPEFLVMREGKLVVAAGALQAFGPVALLRSVVVTESCRNRGYGEHLVGALERHARTRQIRELHLLTTTAAEFFRRAGYRSIERASAPAALQQTEEFRSLCPSSATCMTKSLS